MTMKKNFFVPVILFAIFVFCFGLTGCSDSGNDINDPSGINLAGSSWISDDAGALSLYFSDTKSCSMLILGYEVIRTSYTVTGSVITITVTWMAPSMMDSDIRVGDKDKLTIVDYNHLRDLSGNTFTRVN